MELNEELEVYALGKNLLGCITVWSNPADLSYPLLLVQWDVADVVIVVDWACEIISGRMCEQK